MITTYMDNARKFQIKSNSYHSQLIWAAWLKILFVLNFFSSCGLLTIAAKYLKIVNIVFLHLLETL